MQEECITRFIGIPDYKPVNIYFLNQHGNEIEFDQDVKAVIHLEHFTK